MTDDKELRDEIKNIFDSNGSTLCEYNFNPTIDKLLALIKREKKELLDRCRSNVEDSVEILLRDHLERRHVMNIDLCRKFDWLKKEME